MMPYETLPARLRAIIPAKNGQDIFRNVVNSQLEAGKTESVAMASAWAALQRAGYDKNDDGKWMKKSRTAPSLEKQSYQPPESAKGNAKRVLAWKEKYGDEVKGMTPVGWARARQLASGKPISRDTVARMSAFNRHRKNAQIAPEFKSEPWKDRGYVAWLGWGGTTGVDWARETIGGMEKRQLSDDIFTLPQEAMARSYDIGFGGEIHVHETADGERTYMPGESHDAYLGREDEQDESDDYEEDESEDGEEDESPDDVSSKQGLLERTIAAIMGSIMEHEVTKHATILKTDEESRMVYGWASVSTVKGELVVDHQGDTLEPSEMVKMADGFMASVRTAKAMHQGAGIGEVLHSMPLTQDIMKAFGIQCDREGWLVAMKVHDDNIWALVKSGDLSELSIGGRAGTREAIQ